MEAGASLQTTKNCDLERFWPRLLSSALRIVLATRITTGRQTYVKKGRLGKKSAKAPIDGKREGVDRLAVLISANQILCESLWIMIAAMAVKRVCVNES